MKPATATLIVTFLTVCGPGESPGTTAKKAGPYEATSKSLRKHNAPQWYNDAKLGIFIHWGAYSVSAYHEWFVTYMSPKARFARNLGGPPYTASRGDLPEDVFKANIKEEAYKYQRENYGSDFAYDDFIPMFKAEKFDPDQWAELFKEAGAKYVVLTAKHGEEFALWPTKYTHRNSAQMGPHRDLVGDLSKAVRKQGLKMGFYHNTTYSFWDERYPHKEWVEYMNNSIKELVDLYHPSILWGDVRTGPVRDDRGKPLGADYWNSKELLAYFYNHADDPSQVVANDRWGVDSDGSFLGDFPTPERRKINQISKQKWETCDSLDPTSWGYNRFLKNGEYMTVNELVDYLVDIVSKNGNLLINIGPKADGTIPEVMQDRLREVGKWLNVNGEAIYGSHYWDTYKEGDIRFTRKGNTLYGIALEWPTEQITLQSLVGKKVLNVDMLGLDKPVKWKQNNSDGLVIEAPDKRPCRHAYTFKIECSAL